MWNRELFLTQTALPLNTNIDGDRPRAFQGARQKIFAPPTRRGPGAWRGTCHTAPWPRRKVLPHGASRTLHDQAHLRAPDAQLLELTPVTQPSDLNQAGQRVPLILARTQAPPRR